MKGISPIIASVLLIAITMSIAVVLAAYVTSYTRTATASIPSACIGGAIFVDGSPRCSGNVLTITVDGQFVTLNTFTVDVRNATTKAVLETGTATSGLASLAPGDTGTLTATLTNPVPHCFSGGGVEVRVSTNCFNVKTDWTPTA